MHGAGFIKKNSLVNYSNMQSGEGPIRVGRSCDLHESHSEHTRRREEREHALAPTVQKAETKVLKEGTCCQVAATSCMNLRYNGHNGIPYPKKMEASDQ